MVAERHIDLGEFTILGEKKDLMFWGGMTLYFIGYGLRKNQEKKEN